MMRGTPEEFERQPYLGMTRNERNAEVRTWGDWEPVSGYFLPEQSTEPHESGAVRVVTPAQIIVPFSQPANPYDRWRVRGVIYEQEGGASRWRYPRSGADAGAVVAVKAVSG